MQTGQKDGRKLRRRVRDLVLLSVAACGLVACEPAAPARGPGNYDGPSDAGGDPRIAAVEQRARIVERMAELRVPAVSVAVIDHGAVVWARAYGVTDAYQRQPVNQDTLFQAASISKVLTAIASLRFVQEGRLALDEDVNARLRSWHLPPSAAQQGRAITLRMLLSHTGGLTVGGFRGYAQGEPIPSALDVLDGRPPANSHPVRVDIPPGEIDRYSGGGFVIAQTMLSDAGGAPFDEVMRRTVLEPLGMTHSTFAQPLPQGYWAHAASGHRSNGEPIAGHWFVYPEEAAAGLWTTATDLSHVILELQMASAGSGRVLSPQMVGTMLTRQKRNQGLGIGIAGDGQGQRFSHGGTNQGFRAQLTGTRNTGQGAVILTNSDTGGRLNVEITNAIAAVYGWPDPRGGDQPLLGADASDTAIEDEMRISLGGDDDETDTRLVTALLTK